MRDAFEERREREATQQRLQKRLEQQLREDVQAVAGTEAGRRLIWAFLMAADIDGSPFRVEPAAMGHAVAWQDAGRWWLAQLRDYCPERETQMRAEANRNAREAQKDNDGNDNDE